MAFYPSDRDVPQEMRTHRLLLRPLRATDVEPDYDAVMSSAEMLHRWGQHAWPREGFTLAENLADLQRHELNHVERSEFTYTVVGPEGTRCLGCVYIVPPRDEALPLCEGAVYPAEVAFWVRASELATGLDEHLLDALQAWFRAEWAFDRVLFRTGTQDARHAALFEAAGLGKLLTATDSDGDHWCVFG